MKSDTGNKPVKLMDVAFGKYVQTIKPCLRPSIKDFRTKSRKIVPLPLVRKMSALIQPPPLVRADTP